MFRTPRSTSKLVRATGLTRLAAGAALLLGAGTALATDAPNCSSNVGANPALLSAVGLTSGGSLVCFRVNSPRATAVPIGPIVGLVGSDTALVGIDYRVQNGLLYGVGNGGGIYILDTGTAVAISVGQITEPLSGTAFGVDFNPAANALRIVSNSGQNLRIAFASGAPVTNIDAGLNNGAVPPAAVSGIVGAGYTNNDLLANTATTLFDLNAATNAVMVQSSANSGVLVNTGVFAPDAVDGDLDVYTRANGSNEAYAVVVTASDARVYSLDLLSGQLRGNGGRTVPGMVDIALPLAQ